ncbi:hypothetical protein ScPMuIL_016792 [Solemya velum]
MATKQKKVPVTKHAKLQVPKQRSAVATKSGVKNAKVKKGKLGIKGQPRPAPVVEAGYSLYSTESEEQLADRYSSSQDVCAKVLSQLTSRRAAHQNAGSYNSPYYLPNQAPITGVRIPFNNRLSSSTPDPEKSGFNNSEHLQVIAAEKESNLPSSGAFQKEVVSGQAPPGQFSLGTRPVFAGASLGVTSELVDQPHVNYTRPPLAFQNVSRTVIVPSANQEQDAEVRCGSIIESFQPYLDRESTGFSLPTFGNTETNMHKEHRNDCGGRRSPAPVLICSEKSRDNDELSHSSNIPSTAETSGTEYAHLPAVAMEKPNQPITAMLSGTYTMQNGLYQIHSIDEQRSEKLSGTLKMPISPFRPINSDQPVTQKLPEKYPTFEIPERDDSGKIAKQYDDSKLVSEIASQKTLLQANVNNRKLTAESSLKQNTLPNLIGSVTDKQVEVGGSVADPRVEVKVGGVESSLGSRKSLSSEESLGFIPFQTGSLTTQTPQEQQQQQQNLNKKTVVPANPTAPVGVQIPNGSQQQLPRQTVVPLLSPSGQIDQVLVVCPDGSQKMVPIVTQGMMGSGQYAAQPGHPESDTEVRRLKHLLQELKECSKISKDVELNRLVREVDQSVNTIPHLNLNLRTEVDLALQPLRTENCHLRRRLRIINQQLRDKEQQEKDRKGGNPVNKEVVQLQAKNKILETQVLEGQHRQTKLTSQIRELQEEGKKTEAAKYKIMADFSEKGTEHLKLRQECLRETQKSRRELELMEQQLQSLQLKLEAAEQENHILQISLKQRDDEVSRLQDMVSSLKQSTSTLVQELDHGRQGEKSYILNSSFSLQKVLKLLQQEQKYSFTPTRSVQSDPGQITLAEQTARESELHDRARYRLTKETLEDHDNIWKDKSQETLRGSASDTEVDFTLMEMRGNRRHRLSKHTPSPSSHPQRYPIDGTQRNHRRSLSFSPKRLQHHERNGFDADRDFRRGKKTFSSSLQRIPQLDFDSDSETQEGGLEEVEAPSRFPGKARSKYAHEEQNTMDQSRYSVTDYFDKYPNHRNEKVVKRYQQDHETSNPREVYKANQFKGSEPEVSVSAIDDDKFSSVSGKTFSTVSTATTVDNQAFRKGIEMLDANIAKLQSDLHKRRQLLA